MHVGGGLLFEWIAYSQDSASKEQFPDLTPQYKFRDGRFLLGGRFKTKRPFTWQAGIMWDQLTNKWLVRQTGLMVSVPEIYSHFFVGRAKEGFSLNKVMGGYDGWSMERLPFTDATVPLLADGIKWLGYVPIESSVLERRCVRGRAFRGANVLQLQPPVRRPRGHGSVSPTIRPGSSCTWR